jgi:hypothetical protein
MQHQLRPCLLELDDLGVGGQAVEQLADAAAREPGIHVCDL